MYPVISSSSSADDAELESGEGPGTDDILAILCRALRVPRTTDESYRNATALRKLLDLIRRINEAATRFSTEDVYDGRLFAAVYGLLDALTLQWILPGLSPGVEFALRPKSVVYALPSPISTSHELLAETMQTLYEIVDGRSGIAPLVLQRSLPDVLSGIAELAFHPDLSGSSISASFERIYNNLLEA